MNKTLRILLILATILYGTYIPTGQLYAAQSDSVTIKVRVIDTAPQGSIVINKGDKYTISTSVVLTLSAQDSESNVVAMQFSNDNILWSTTELYATTKTWDLTVGVGEKTVYVKFYDKAGNVSQTYSDSITLYSGTLIDPATGGEVLSPDGRIKLIIPPEAIPLDRGLTSIILMLLDPGDFQNSTPQSYQLRVILDCKPNGLIFYKNVKYPQFKEWPQLIITLSQSEVPGTPIELGYLNEQNQIELMQETPSSITSDGITVEFLINHFSTYAGLSSMLSQGAPIGAGVKIPLPDMLTGAFGHSIPITVPPGRKGMQPNVSLQYRSSGPNSWVGFGWSLNPGYIVRSTKLGPPTYDDKIDTFIFATDSGSTELVHLIDNLYQAKIESAFAKFYKETDDSWKVVQKDGTILLFGEDADSKEMGLKETNVAATFLWNLTQVTDNNSNYIKVNYTKDHGKSYLKYIDYTGPSPKNTIIFTLEDRTDISSSFISGSEVKTAKRLKEINVKQNNLSDPVWTYVLEYYEDKDYTPDTKPDTNRSLLKSITQKAADGKPLPTQTFKYQRNEIKK